MCIRDRLLTDYERKMNCDNRAKQGNMRRDSYPNRYPEEQNRDRNQIVERTTREMFQDTRIGKVEEITTETIIGMTGDMIIIIIIITIIIIGATTLQITVERILYAATMIPESTIVVTRGRLIEMNILAMRRDLSLIHI